MAKLAIKHIGEKKRMNNGMLGEIIAYRSCTDIDVKFQDGTIIKNRRYRSFKQGTMTITSLQNNRIGEKNYMKNGLTATIIEYRSSIDIDVEFEDGTIIKNKPYDSFKRGVITIRIPITKRIGKKKRMNCGMVATIIAYRDSKHIDIEFENGVIIKNRAYGDFTKGSIAGSHALRNRIGEKNRMCNGMIAEIITYRNSCNIDIKFEDGTVIKNVRYSNFKRGSIVITHKLSHRIGEKNRMRNGMVAEIIAYHRANNIDIKFEDGTIVKNRSYINFKKGIITIMGTFQHRVGEKKRMNNGMVAEIITYRNVHDIDIKFEDGTVIKNRGYQNFLNGKITSKTVPIANRIGEKKRMHNGMIAEIIAYHNVKDIDVEFEDGVILKNQSYERFTKGKIGNKRVTAMRERIGEKKCMNNCMVARIIDYRGAGDIDIQFEDGVIVKNRGYSWFQCGTIGHPTFRHAGTIFNIQITRIAYQLQSPNSELPTTYFNYVHPDTKEHCIGIISDIHQLALDYKLIPEPQLLVFE